MLRFLLIAMLAGGMLAGCEKQALHTSKSDWASSPEKRLGNALELTSPQGRFGNPFHRHGRSHNEGFRDLILSTHFEGGIKGWILSMGEFLGVDGKATWDLYRGLLDQAPIVSASNALAQGADPLAVQSWLELTGRFDQIGPANSIAVNAMIDSVEWAIGQLAAAGDIDAEPAFAVSSIFRYSYALHTGQVLDGVDYGLMPWNPTPDIIADPMMGVTIDVGKIVMADAFGYLWGQHWGAVAASAIELISQLDAAGWNIHDFFGMGVVHAPDIEVPVLPGLPD